MTIQALHHSIAETVSTKTESRAEFAAPTARSVSRLISRPIRYTAPPPSLVDRHGWSWDGGFRVESATPNACNGARWGGGGSESMGGAEWIRSMLKVVDRLHGEGAS